jgi:Na+-driven multidrug efflux pump
VRIGRLKRTDDGNHANGVNLFGFCLFEIPLAYTLAIPLKMHSNGVFFSIAIAESSMAVASAVLFKQGKWKKQKI